MVLPASAEAEYIKYTSTASGGELASVGEGWKVPSEVGEVRRELARRER